MHFYVDQPKFALEGVVQVKSDTTKIFTAFGFLKVDCILQTSRTNKKQDMSMKTAVVAI